MKTYFKYVIFIVIYAACLVNSYSQSSNNQSYDFTQIEAYFRHEDLVIEPEETFFNVLTVVNRGTMPEVVQVDFNAPMGWTLITDGRRNITIAGGDSIVVPMRVAASRDVRGEIGYAVIASVKDRDDQNLANAYCYLKIPAESNLRFRPLTRVSYFDQETGESEISFMFENRGNIDEVIYINLTSTESVSLPRERNNEFAFELRLDAGKDTTITLPVQLDDENNYTDQTLYRVDLDASTEKDQFSTTFWFSHLTNYFRYTIPPGEIPLTAELIIHNLFSEYDPYLSGSVMGNILFDGNRDIDYRFRAHGIGRRDDILRHSRYRVAFNAPDYNIAFGDVASIPLKYGLGRGLKAKYRFLDRNEITGVVAENRFRPIRTYGGSFDSYRKNFDIHTRFAHVDNQFFNTEAFVYGAGTNLQLFEGHSLSIDGGLSDATYKTVDQQEIGYGFIVNYMGRINNLRIRLREQYGSTNYYGSFVGRHNFRGSMRYHYKDGLLFTLRFNDRKNKPVIESESGITSDRFSSSRRANFRTTKYLDPGFALFFGPLYRSRATNSYIHFDDTPFETHSANLEIGARIRENHHLFFNPSLELGYNFVSDYSIPLDGPSIAALETRDEFFNAQFSFSLRRGDWGTFLNYFYGPYGLHQQINYFYRGTYTQNLRLMPYYEGFIYQDMLKLSSQVNFTHDFTYKTTRFYFQNQLDFFFDRGFSVTLLNTMGYQVSTDLVTEDQYDYSSTYFEIRLRKDFHWDQPRIKYHDLTVNLFKDLQGTLERDPNDPGIANILVTIHREDPRYYDEFDKDYEYTGRLVNNKLLSDMYGKVVYENLAAGLYRIEINNIGEERDNFVPDVREVLVHVTEDKVVDIPFLERNRIFGQVVLNRSKLSTLGRIDVSNIRIEAVDSRGNTISTFTDSEGKFELYAPSLDDYVVSVRDVFEEHFNLRQNNFIVHLNAYNQFEVNFIFDEKRRRIDFRPSERDIEVEAVSVSRTNLSGNVKDRATLQPVRATVEVVDNETGETIVSTRSDRTTGRFNTSFMTDENYSIMVSAPGYWLYTDDLRLERDLTIQDVEKEILIENIIVGSKVELRNLVFASGSDEIPPEAYAELDRFIEQLKQNPNIRIQIAGHSDGRETIDNPELSAKRAEAVAKYMFDQGFGNIEYVGYKDSRPIAPDDTEENRARNRRVEITIIDK